MAPGVIALALCRDLITEWMIKAASASKAHIAGYITSSVFPWVTRQSVAFPQNPNWNADSIVNQSMFDFIVFGVIGDF